MTSMIHDYFAKSCKENKPVTIPKVDHRDIADERCIAEETSPPSVDVLSGKENMEANVEAKCTPHVKERSKGASKSNVPDKKKGRKSKSLSSRKHGTSDLKESLEKTSPDHLKSNCADPPAHNFSLKIRIKTKEQVDNEDFIEEFTSPEMDKSADDKGKGMKSPQSTLLKYFIPQKSPSLSEVKASKCKVNRDISDFFSPSVSKKEEASASSEEIIKHDVESDKIEESPKAHQKTESHKSDVLKSTKKPRKKKLCITKKTQNNDVPGSPASRDTVVTPEPLGKKSKSAVSRSKSSKKSLSLANNQVCVKSADPSSEPTEETAKSMKVSKPLVSQVNAQPKFVAESIKDKFKNIMSRSSCDDGNAASPSRSISLSSKKRKRHGKDDSASDPKPASDDSPVKSKRRLGISNQIGGDSDDDSVNIQSLDNQKKLSLVASNDDLCVISNDAERHFKVGESKRNSLEKYFQKVSKEEILAKNDKVEMKVKALVHSPPTTPSKKVKRRSVNSLPGGAASLNNKKRGNLKIKLKENVNAIETIDVDETKSTLIDDKFKLDGCRNVQSQKVMSKKAVANASSSDLKTSKRISSRGTEKQLTNSTPSSQISVKSAEEEKTKSASPVPSLSSCSLKVSFPPQQLPSSQGTLLEEDSDNEEIFLSQRRKKRKTEPVSKSGDPGVEFVAAEPEKTKSPDIIFEKKVGKNENIKMAPLFTRKADSQARQLFLQSGVPNQVKRIFESQHSFEEQEIEIFPKQSHIQQRNADEWIWRLPEVQLPLTETCNQEIIGSSGTFSFEDLTGCPNIKGQVDRIVAASCKGPEMRPVFCLPMDIVKPILHMIRQESPSFMVVKTFKALKEKCREDEFMKAGALSTLSEVQRPKRKSSNRKSNNSRSMPTTVIYRCPVWTEKYKPTCSSEIVGNGESVVQLKRWLEAWRKASEDVSKLGKEETKRKKKKKDFIDEDFLVSDNSSDSGHSNLPVGVAVLYGPNGSGKTSTVYALSKDLGFKVLEVNASEKRNGKYVLSKLSEATQSHQVQQSSTAEQGFSALFGKSSTTVKTKKQKPNALKRMDSDEEKSKKMSLILFEDVDIVFEEEDEGFLSAITNLVSTSKRPVILTTTDPESPLISRFMSSSNLLLEFSCPLNLQSTWLQIVSLVEGVFVAPETVKDLVSLCKGDFRRALLQMQLWVMSGGNNISLPPIPLHPSHKSRKASKGDGKDDTCDLEDGVDYGTPSIPANPDCIASMLGQNDVDEGSEIDINQGPPYVKVPYPLKLGLFWWNIPPLLSLKQLQHGQLPVAKEWLVKSGSKGMLDDSFLASFCTDDGSTNDSAANEDVNVTSSQEFINATSGESRESRDPDSLMSTDCPENTDSVALKSSCTQEEMFTLAYQMIVLSSIDVISVSSGLSCATDVEPVCRFSQPFLKDSLALVKEEVEGPNFVFESTSEDICHWLAEQTINRTRNSLCSNLSDVQSQYNNCLPNEDEKRWRCLHAKIEQEVMNVIPYCVALEHKALATDYFPSLRTVCRLEQNKKILNSKRGNRFYHYLKSLGANLTDSMLQLLCRTMCDL